MPLPGLGLLRRALAAARARAGALVAAGEARARRRSVERAGELPLEAFLDLLGLPRDPAPAWAELARRSPPSLLPDPARSAALVRERLPAAAAALLEDARRAREHVFDLLGSGPTPLGAEIDWQKDWKTNARWPLLTFQEIPIKVSRGGPEDVKLPWELSRFYHASALGRAYATTKDEACPGELEALMAAQALDFRLRANPKARMGRGTEAAYALIRRRVPFLNHDEYLHPHILAVEHLVSTGKLAQVANQD